MCDDEDEPAFNKYQEQAEEPCAHLVERHLESDCSSRVRTCSSLTGVGLVYFVIDHSFGICQPFGDALPGPVLAPGWRRRHFDRQRVVCGNMNA